MSKPQFGDYGEPWTQKGVLVVNRYGKYVVGPETIPRILLCVNACSGLSDEQLKRVRAVNELYEACKEVKLILGRTLSQEFWQMLDRAIALAEGKEGE